MNAQVEQPSTLHAIPHLIGGKESFGTSGRWSGVYNPATGLASGRVALASSAEVGQAVGAAAAAFPAWAATTPLNRARVMFRFKELVERHALRPRMRVPWHTMQ